MTVNELLKCCENQVKKGNGNKQIVISDDDEGNGYHELYYGFTDDLEEIKEISECVYVCDDDEVDKIVLLG